MCRFTRVNLYLALSSSLQLQSPDPVTAETTTYAAVRPYRESPLLARARRTESFSSHPDFQSFNLAKVLREHSGQCDDEGTRDTPDVPSDPRRRAHSSDEGVPEGTARRKGVLEGNFLGRKRAPPVPQLSPASVGSEAGGSDSSSTASPSPTKASTSPRHRRILDSSE